MIACLMGPHTPRIIKDMQGIHAIYSRVWNLADDSDNAYEWAIHTEIHPCIIQL